MPKIHPTALIGPNVTIGKGTYIGPYCMIGYPAEHKTYWGKYNDTGVRIGDNCVITGMVTIDAGTEHDTIIGDNVWMLKHSHVGHDCLIDDNVTISCGAKIGGHSVIEKGCNIGLNAVIHQKQIVPQGCMIGMGAVITKGLLLEPNSKYVGNPAKYLGPNVIK